jgi:precorrin-2 dehydrogenase/sirohydrochlorin ferrochelatase
MLPIILTKKQKVLIVGGGRACEIKMKILSKQNYDITIVSQEFSKNLERYNFTKIQNSFSDLEYDFFLDFDLIYIAIDLDDYSMIDKLLKTKMINITSNPSYGNFIHPCSRENDELIVSVSTKGKSPKRACEIANKLTLLFENFHKGF